MQIGVVAAAALGLGAVIWAAAGVDGDRSASTALGAVVGFGGGIALYHAAFGFTGAWRAFQRERRSAGVRAQLLMLAAIVVASYPLLAYGRDFGVVANGWVFPMGLTSAIGAFMFGVGMQLGGGCGSGTLFTVGGGSTRMMLTLAAFIGGSVIWSATQSDLQASFAVFERGLGFEDRARIDGVSLIRVLGPLGALGATLAALAALYWAVRRAEIGRHGALAPARETQSLVSGPWSLSLGAFGLAATVIATFLVLGRPWGITSAFEMWGVKAIDAVGLPIRDWGGWSHGALNADLFAHSTGVQNFGVMLGALAAAGLGGRFAPKLSITPRDAATAVVGGLLMGYGARLAWGCNIGGFVGGVASASLHGWWWLAFGAAGSILGVWVRGRIGMDPRPA